MRKGHLYTTAFQGLPIKGASLINHYFQIHIVYLSLVLKCWKPRLMMAMVSAAFAKDGDKISLENLFCVIQSFLIGWYESRNILATQLSNLGVNVKITQIIQKIMSSVIFPLAEWFINLYLICFFFSSWHHCIHCNKCNGLFQAIFIILLCNLLILVGIKNLADINC